VRRTIVGVVAALVVVVVGTWVLFFRDPPIPYAALRQTTLQAIPGTLGYALEPPPDDLRPELSPDEVRRRYPAGTGEVQVALASLRDTHQDRVLGSGWVLVARGVCLRNSKGELVSDARGNDPVDLQCTDDQVWVLAVDASSAEPIAALVAYDDTGTWGPEVESSFGVDVGS
jgi:hypothetical protein